VLLQFARIYEAPSPWCRVCMSVGCRRHTHARTSSLPSSEREPLPQPTRSRTHDTSHTRSISHRTATSSTWMDDVRARPPPPLVAVAAVARRTPRAACHRVAMVPTAVALTLRERLGGLHRTSTLVEEQECCSARRPRLLLLLLGVALRHEVLSANEAQTHLRPRLYRLSIATAHPHHRHQAARSHPI